MANTYITVSGDMWDAIALKTLGSENRKDALINNNLQYRHTYIFPAGVVLTIPAIAPLVPQSMPPWKRGGVS